MKYSCWVGFRENDSQLNERKYKITKFKHCYRKIGDIMQTSILPISCLSHNHSTTIFGVKSLIFDTNVTNIYYNILDVYIHNARFYLLVLSRSKYAGWFPSCNLAL